MADEKLCPECGGELVPIVYGYPSAEAFKAAQDGELVLGGCCVSDADPPWECSGCATRFHGPPLRPAARPE